MSTWWFWAIFAVSCLPGVVGLVMLATEKGGSTRWHTLWMSMMTFGGVAALVDVAIGWLTYEATTPKHENVVRPGSLLAGFLLVAVVFIIFVILSVRNGHREENEVSRETRGLSPKKGH